MHEYTNRGDALNAVRRLKQAAQELSDEIAECKSFHDREGDGCTEQALAGAEQEVAVKLSEAILIEQNLPDELTCRDCGVEDENVRDDWELREGTSFCGECATIDIGEHYPEDWRIER